MYDKGEGPGIYIKQKKKQYVWIYEDGVKEFKPYHPYVTLISLLLN